MSENVKPDVAVVTFDSAGHTMADLCFEVRQAHFRNEVPFKSMAFANHGPQKPSGLWRITADVETDVVGNKVPRQRRSCKPPVKIHKMRLS